MDGKPSSLDAGPEISPIKLYGLKKEEVQQEYPVNLFAFIPRTSYCLTVSTGIFDP